MQALQPYEINHVDFSSRFKSIRNAKDTHLGDYALMKDKQTKKRVIVKPQQFETQQELQYVLQGIEALLILNECPSIVKFVGYSVKGKVINLIYENHQSTLQESTKTINSKPLSDKSLLTFLFNMTEALSFLETLNLNHLDIKLSNILQQNKESLNNCYKLFYTNYTTDSVSQIRNLQTPIDSYFLSSLQLDYLNSEEIQLTFEDKIHSDIQSLGLICLWLGTPSIKDKYYQYNQEDELQINQQAISKRMKQFRKNYSKKTIKILEILLCGQQDTFNDILNTITSEGNNNKSKKHITISEQNQEKEISSMQQSFQKYHQKSIVERQKSKSKKTDESLMNTERQVRRKQYLQSLGELEQRLIYRPGTKDLLPNMEQKQYADGSYYIGQLSETRQRQGKGIYYYSEGDIYAGDWRDNTLQGYGIYLFSNGQKYEGGVQKGVKVGKGEYLYCNNNKYEGQWQNDKKHGYGVYLYQNKGQKYQGQFHNGSKQGQGAFYYSNGDKYEGNFHHGDKHGKGVAKYDNGNRLIGNWEAGQISGNGTIDYKNGDKSSSLFSKGVKNGHGNYIYKNSTQFNGTYEDNYKTGECTINYANGDVYEGNLVKGLRDGEGTYHYSNGIIYKGAWKDNFQQGNGRLTLPNGTTICGNWKHSNLSNPCQIVYPNRDVYTGNTVKLFIKQGQGSYLFTSGQKLQGQFKNNSFVKGIFIDEIGKQTFI